MTEEVKVKLAMLERDFVGLKDVVDKLENSIDKLTSISSCMERMLAVHENVNDNQKQVNDVLFEKLEQERQDNKREHNELSEKVEEFSKTIKNDINALKQLDADRMEKLEQKVDVLEQWKFMVMGGAAVIGALSSIFVKFIMSLFQ
jgi:DNA repair exonuclease SbcCD ATPase subunit